MSTQSYRYIELDLSDTEEFRWEEPTQVRSTYYDYPNNTGWDSARWTEYLLKNRLVYSYPEKTTMELINEIEI